MKTQKMFPVRLIVFIVLSISSVLCKKVCDYEDFKCLTDGANRLYEPFVLGKIPGVESSEPLRKDLIEVNLPKLTSKLINSSLSGMKDCVVESVIVSKKEQRYDYNVSCPHVTMETDFELKGELDSKTYDETGSCKVDLYDFYYYMHGNYDKKIDDTGKIHFHLVNHVLETVARGKVEYDSTSHDYAAKDKVIENCQVVDKVGRQPAMDAFMDKYLLNLESFFNALPTEDIYYYAD